MGRTVRTVGSHELVAEERLGFGWEVRIAGYVWASGLTETDANECLARLAKAHLRPRSLQKARRVECPICKRSVAVVRGLIGWHNEQEPAPGREPKMCRGYGAKPQ